MTKTLSQHETLIGLHLEELGIKDYVREYRFCAERRWRFDVAVLRPDMKLAVELEGGIWVAGGGGHNRGRAFMDDLEKYNEATALGWAVFRFAVEDVLKGLDIPYLKVWLGMRKVRL